MQRFSAPIYKIGINPVVDPPDDVLEAVFAQAGRSKGPIPIAGRLNGHQFVQTLVKYRGAWRLYINGQMLKGSHLSVGATAEVEIEFDPRPREVPVPPEFASALDEADAAARAAFDELPRGRRNEILRYLGSLKTEASLERNIERVVRDLAARGEGEPHITLKKRISRTKAQKKGGR